MPSKKFIIILSSVFGVILLVFIVGSLIGLKEKAVNLPTESEITVSQETLSVLISKDSDGDGVPDWEEALWGTDPNKKDTNGDGIPDNIEIENKKKALRESGSYPEQTQEENLNETERFSREFFTTFAALKQSGNLSPEAMINLSTSLISTLEKSKDALVFFTARDIRIENAPDYTQSDYASAVMAMASKFSDKKLGYELEILAEGITNENKAAMDELAQIAENYNEFALVLKSLPVPQTLSRDHLVLINSALGISQTLKNLSQTLSNPLVVMSSLSQYDTFSQSFVEIMSKISSLI